MHRYKNVRWIRMANCGVILRDKGCLREEGCLREGA